MGRLVVEKVELLFLPLWDFEKPYLKHEKILRGSLLYLLSRWAGLIFPCLDEDGSAWNRRELWYPLFLHLFGWGCDHAKQWNWKKGRDRARHWRCSSLFSSGSGGVDPFGSSTLSFFWSIVDSSWFFEQGWRQEIWLKGKKLKKSNLMLNKWIWIQT